MSCSVQVSPPQQITVCCRMSAVPRVSSPDSEGPLWPPPPLIPWREQSVSRGLVLCPPGAWPLLWSIVFQAWSQTSSHSSTWDLVERQFLGPLLTLTESGNLGMGPRIFAVTSPSGDSDEC